MHILYLWVEKLSNNVKTNRKGYNLDGRYNFEYNEDPQNKSGVLRCKRNSAVPYKYFAANTGENGSVSSITAVVGKNGEGKTTFLYKLIRGLCGKNGYPTDNIPMILALEKGGNVYLYSTIPNIIVEIAGDVVVSNLKNGTVPHISEMDFSTPIIFHTNTFDKDQYSDPYGVAGVHDISFVGAIRHAYEYRGVAQRDHSLSELRLFIDEDMIRQIDFVCDSTEKQKKRFIPFRLPKKLFVKFVDSNAMMYDVKEPLKSGKHNLEMEFAKLAEEILKRYKSNFENDLKWRYNLGVYLNRGILCSYINQMLPRVVGIKTNDQIGKRIEQMKEFLQSAQEMDTPEAFVLALVGKEEPWSKELRDSIRGINRLVVNYEPNGIPQSGFKISVEDGNMKEFYQLFVKTASMYHYLTFQWPLSTGENNLLTLYARLFSVSKKEEIKRSKDLIFLFDESDLSFHPEWQRKYIYNLNEFMNIYFPQKSIQIILTTHSPIMLSDMLNGNVIFLGEEQGEIGQTFAANIYDLYRNSLFMESTPYGLIGEFAYTKISELIEKMEDVENWQKGEKQSTNDIQEFLELEEAIECIGENTLKKVLLNRYYRIKSKLCVKENGAEEEFGALLHRVSQLSEAQKKQLRKLLPEE